MKCTSTSSYQSPTIILKEKNNETGPRNSHEARIKMIGWKSILVLLCLFGFLKEFRPSEPFVTDFLTGPWKNFSSEQVSRDILPIAIYSNLATLVVIFLLTDLLLYKPIIVLCGLSGIATYMLLIFAKSLLEMQILECTYGLFMSSEVAYFTYIYTKVDKQHYEKVTGYTRAAFLSGKFLAGLVSQLVVSFGILDYLQLNYLTLTAEILATLVALFLPSVKHSLYFHRGNCEGNAESMEIGGSTSSRKISFLEKSKNACVFLWQDFLRAYGNAKVLKWSLWWALSTCGYLQILSYIQLLWKTAVEKDADIYNGAVEAIYAIIGAATVSLIGLMKLDWALYGEAILTFFSVLEGVLLIIASKCYNIWILYVCYIVFGVVYHTIVTVASFEVAKRLTSDSYGLIFGINTFAALCVQSLLTFVVVDDRFFNLDTRSQYFIYGWYFIILGSVFLIFAIVTIVKHGCSNNLAKSTECINDKRNNISDGISDQSAIYG